MSIVAQAESDLGPTITNCGRLRQSRLASHVRNNVHSEAGAPTSAARASSTALSLNSSVRFRLFAPLSGALLQCHIRPAVGRTTNGRNAELVVHRVEQHQ